MSYATINDLRKMFESAIACEKFYIMITIEVAGYLECFTYGQGISDDEVRVTLREGMGGK